MMNIGDGGSEGHAQERVVRSKERKSSWREEEVGLLFYVSEILILKKDIT